MKKKEKQRLEKQRKEQKEKQEKEKKEQKEREKRENDKKKKFKVSGVFICRRRRCERWLRGGGGTGRVGYMSWHTNLSGFIPHM